MNILVLSNIEASGEWLATQTLLAEVSKKIKNVNFYLIAYGKNTLLLDKNKFELIHLVDKYFPNPPLRYYKQIVTEFLQGRNAIKKRLLQVGKFDLMIATDPFLLLAALSLMTHIRSIFWFHGFRTNYHLKKINPYIFIRKYLERLAFLLTNEIVVPSNFAKKILQGELFIFARLKKIYMIPNIPRLDFNNRLSLNKLREFRKKFSLPVGKKIILFSGIVDPRKGLVELLKAFSILKKTHQDVILVIAYLPSVSDKQYLDKMTNFINQNSLTNNIRMLTNLDLEQLSMLYQTSYCAVLPSIFETFGLFILESLLSTLPIFSTRVGAGADILEKIDRGFLLKDNSPATIAKALSDFISKPDEWHKQMREKIDLRYKKYNFEEPVNKLARLFAQSQK